MEVGSQPHAMASVHQRKETLELIEQVAGWGLRVGRGIWIREYLLPLPCSEPHFLGHPANSLVTIPTTTLSHQSKYVKIELYKPIILPFVLYGFKHFLSMKETVL